MTGFTSWRLKILQAACADPSISATSFRLMSRVSAAINQHTGKAVLGDDLIRDEVVGFRGEGSVRKHRRAIEKAGYWQVEAGSGLCATVYIFTDRPVAAIVERLKASKMKRGKRRADRHSAVHAAQNSRRELQAGTPVHLDGGVAPITVSSTPVQSDRGASTEWPQRKKQDEAGLKRPSTPVQLDGHTYSSFPSCSKKEAYEKEVLSREHARERVLALYRFDPREIELAVLQIGEGSSSRGYELLALHDDHDIRSLGVQLDEAGAKLSAHEIRAVRRAALRIEDQNKRRAANDR